MEMHCVLFEIRAKFLNIIYMSFLLQRVNGNALVGEFILLHSSFKKYEKRNQGDDDSQELMQLCMWNIVLQQIINLFTFTGSCFVFWNTG
jgi:hypothetical protein